MLDDLILDTEVHLKEGTLSQEEKVKVKSFINNVKPAVEKQENFPVLSKLYELEALTLYEPDDGSMFASLCFSTAMNLVGTPYDYNGLMTETARNWAKNYGGIHTTQDRFTYGPWQLGYDLESAYINNDSYVIYGNPVPIRNMLAELEGEELKAFLKAGAKLERKGEKIFGAIQPVNNYMLKDWDTVISTYNGKIYKIALTYQLYEQYLDLVMLKIQNDLNRRVGKAKSNHLDKNELIFEGNDVRVRVQQRKLPVDDDIYQINLIAKDIR